MKFNRKQFLEVIVSVSFISMVFLAGCGGGGSQYDGPWTAVYTDSALVLPVAASGATVACTTQNPIPTITIYNGSGSVVQNDPCTGTAANPGGVLNLTYNISVAINVATGAVQAVVNGSTLTGQCISSQGCAAQSGSGSLSLTR